MSKKPDLITIEKTTLLNSDIRYMLFRAYIIIAAVLSMTFAIIHLINRRPAVNIITSAVSFGLCVFWYLMSGNYRRYGIARISFLVVFSIIWLPLGYLTSPGSYSAMPYMAILVVFILAVVVRNTWEYLFPLLMIFQMPFLFRTEIWFPDLYVKYTDELYRINDLTMNFSVVISAIFFTIIFMMHRYHQMNLQLYDLSVLDDLTGLYNKRYLYKFLEMEQNRSVRHGRGFALVFVDLDNFKNINDSLGHMAGDRVLKGISDIIRENIRSYDIAARYGGDEFVIIFPEADKVEAEKRMTGLEKQFRIFSEQYRDQDFSVSWGMTESQGKTIDEILNIADKNLYEKKAGNND